jgi:protein-S-isoprenylcysteine O-methyltransferase Ste14
MVMRLIEFTFDFISASALVILLSVFLSISLWSIEKARSGRRARTKGRTKEVPFEESFRTTPIIALAFIATLIFGGAVLSYILLVYADSLVLLDFVSFRNLIPFDSFFQLAGLFLLVFGFLFFSSSIVVRTGAAESKELVTWGPFKYVRHPSYFSYMLMFIGLFLLWSNVLTAIILIGIPGYFRVVFQEEAFLSKTFGKRYAEYQEITGRLFPKLRRRGKNLNHS